MSNKLFLFLALLTFFLSSSACSAANRQPKVSNLRMALDPEGRDVRSSFAPNDVFYVVADLANAPRGTKFKAKWIALNTIGADPNFEFQTQTLDVTKETLTGKMYFQLSNDNSWPAGQYRVDLYLNDTPAGSVEFSVQ